ncbi:MAG: outer membrane receptor for ferrienterochelin and colicins, partial [Flavobacteriales bacterium]
MRFLKFLVLLLLLQLTYLSGNAQISGEVSCEGKAIAYTTLVCDKFQISANGEGRFDYPQPLKGKILLQISALGFESKSVSIIAPSTDLHIELKESAISLDAAVISGSLSQMSIRDMPAKIEVMSAQLLREIPVATLTESIQFQNGIQEVVACGVCATSDIHINGIEGAYTLILIDGMPVVGALASIYGLSGIPTSIIQQIEIIKGPASALYGSEAMGGVINVITKQTTEQFSASASISSSTLLQSQTEMAVNIPLNENNGLLISADVQKNSMRFDRNNDDFTDIPTFNKASLFSKWQHRNDQGGRLNIATRIFYEDRFGGELDFEQDQHLGQDEVYGEFIKTNRFEVLGSATPGKHKVWQADWSISNHAQDSYYGTTHFTAEHQIFFANLYWHKVKAGHDITIGTTQRIERYNDNTSVLQKGITFQPGVFIQDLWRISNRFRLQPGFRVDLNPFHGAIAAPRLNAQWNVNGQTTVRLSAGKGFREVNLITEDHAALSGAREIVISEELKPEISYSYSANIRHSFVSANGYGAIDFDLFHTYFTNKILPDYDAIDDAIVYSNLSGHGVSQGASLSANFTHNAGWNFALGTTFLESFERNGEIKELQFFTPQTMSTARFSYKWKKTNTKISWNALLYGPMRLPEFSAPFERPTQSEWFS